MRSIIKVKGEEKKEKKQRTTSERGKYRLLVKDSGLQVKERKNRLQVKGQKTYGLQVKRPKTVTQTTGKKAKIQITGKRAQGRQTDYS